MEILQINIHPWHVFSFQIIATDTVLLWNKTGVSSFVPDLKECNNSKSKLRQDILQFDTDQIPNNFQFKCFFAGTSEARLKLYVTKFNTLLVRNKKQQQFRFFCSKHLGEEIFFFKYLQY